MTQSPLGTCHAVHTFLERALGIRWYLPTDLGEVIPAQKTIEVKANIPESEWREQFLPPEEFLDYFSTESEFRAAAAPYVCQIVTIRHPDFPNGLWHLRLPEKIVTDDTATTGSYQEEIHWSKTADGWFFEELPLAGLEGTLQGKIAASRDGVDYSLTVTNKSNASWPRVLAWLCFNHCMAKTYDIYRNFLCRDGEMVETPSRVEEHYCVQGHQRAWWTRGSIEPTESLIATSCRDETGNEFSVGIAAANAIILGQNPSWPCTDIGLFFGDVSPGLRTTVGGKIYFHRGPPMGILRRYKSENP
jgi:hypothetical protein